MVPIFRKVTRNARGSVKEWSINWALTDLFIAIINLAGWAILLKANTFAF